MNSTGDRVVVGAPENGGNGIRSGHVRIYEWNGTVWNQLGADVYGEAAYDQSGYSVCIDSVGNRIAIGATKNSGNGTDAGHVRVYLNNLPTNISEVESKNQLSIYPNPVHENLILETQNSIGETAQLTSITGALVLEFRITKEKEKIDLGGFQNGVYFLRVGEVIKKVVISK